MTVSPKAPDVLARPLALALENWRQPAGRRKSSGRSLISTILRKSGMMNLLTF